jgi:hypothetical protein
MNLEQAKQRFNHHVLESVTTRSEDSDVTVYQYKNRSGTIIDHQTWIIYKGTLTVLGDNGSAVYRWNDKGISLKFLAGCNLDYFSSKCLADYNGADQLEYDADKAGEIITDVVIEYVTAGASDPLETPVDFSTWAKDQKLEFVRKRVLELTGYCDYEYNSLFYFEYFNDACDFLRAEKNEHILGSDAWEWANELKTYTAAPVLHLAALKSAYIKYPELPF